MYLINARNTSERQSNCKICPTVEWLSAVQRTPAISAVETGGGGSWYKLSLPGCLQEGPGPTMLHTML